MSDSGYAGFQSASDASGDFNATKFMIEQLINKTNTAGVVKVLAVTNTGGAAPVGFVDVQIMVSQVDGAGTVYPHGTIHNLPYFRLQGGTNAIILDPTVGDIGAAVFCSHDISAVKANKAVSPPGSGRRYDWADGLYFGGLLNGAPAQFIAFSGAGIAVTSPTAITLTAPIITLDGNVSSTGTLMNNGVDVGSTHTHLYSPGSGTPVPTGTPE